MHAKFGRAGEATFSVRLPPSMVVGDGYLRSQAADAGF
jgi:hypothetical protein